MLSTWIRTIRSASSSVRVEQLTNLVRSQSTAEKSREGSEEYDDDFAEFGEEDVEFYENPFSDDKTVFYKRTLNVPEVLRRFRPPRQCWVHSYDDFSKRGIIELHPEVFAVNPRIDLIYDVVKWQEACVKEVKMEYSRAELPGSGNKQQPQKGTGRARRKGERAPHFLYGGKAHPSRPYDYGYDIDHRVLANGFTALLTVKLAQSDLVILDSLSQFTVEGLERLKSRLKTESVLFVTGYDGLDDDKNMEICFTPSIDLLTTETVHPLAILDHVTLVLDYKAVVQLEQWSLSLLGHDTTVEMALTETVL